MRCRHCHTELETPFLDLGTAPPSNAYLSETDLNKPEAYYPLRVLVCDACWLAQTEDFANAEDLFTEDYGYFSSMSQSWLKHCETFVEQAIQRFSLDAQSMIVEIAANDGYLLQYVKAREVPCYGIEPTQATANAARERGLDILQAFFGEQLASSLATQGRTADLTIANNVLAHVPLINDFVSGFRCLLKPDGVAVFEFPHLLRLIEGVQFDTVYHEHFSYLSLTAVISIFADNGLDVFDVDELPTHGGSLRVYAQRRDTGRRPASGQVDRVRELETQAGLTSQHFYTTFQSKAEAVKDDFVSYLVQAKRAGLKVVGYGAAAKGNTLINFAGIRSDLISFIVDRSPGKQGRWTPGARIPIVHEDCLRDSRPDRIIILPWNLEKEITEKLSYVRDWGGKFVTAVPELREF